MAERKRNSEISALYLELASECFNKAATAEDAGTADALQRMGGSYFAHAVVLNPLLNNERSSKSKPTLRDQGD